MGVYHTKILHSDGMGKGLILGTCQAHTVLIGLKKVLRLEFHDTLFYTECSAMMPEGKPAKTQEESEPVANEGIGLIAECLRYQKYHAQKKLLVTGHADTKGKADYNQSITLNRANVVLAAVNGDRELFKKSADAPHMDQVRSKDNKASIQRPGQKQVLNWVAREFGWPCSAEENPDFWTAVRNFQRSYNENGKAGNTSAPDQAVDGDFGPETWGAVFDCYQCKAAEMLQVQLSEMDGLRKNLKYVNDNVKTAGCSEYHPIEEPERDEWRSQTNRRVEVLFFDPGEEPEIACFEGGCGQQDCELYDKTRYDKKHITVSNGDDETPYLFIGWSDDFIMQLPPESSLSLTGEAINTQRILFHAGLREEGIVRFTFELNSARGPCSLRAQTASKTITLWDNQFIDDEGVPARWSGSLSDLLKEENTASMK